MKNRTQNIGNKTAKVKKINSRTAIFGKDPSYDYSFKQKSQLEYAEREGWEQVTATNHQGEKWGGVNFYKSKKGSKTGGAKQFVIEDTVLCKREKSASKYFQELENEKYNNQLKLLREAAPTARLKARRAGLEGEIVNQSSGGDYTQRTGPTEA